MDYLLKLSENIAFLRKKQGMTQEGLAGRLDLSFQAVSKWENGQSSPDISLLPRLSEIFGVSVDELFGITKKDVPAVFTEPPGEDDDTLYVAVYKGRTLLKSVPKPLEHIRFVYEGEALNVTSVLSLQCGNIDGSAAAGTHIICGNEQNKRGDYAINGCASAGSHIQCDSINGCASAGSHIQCDSVSGSVSAGSTVTCDSVSGDVNAGGSVTCDSVSGNVTAGGSVTCDIVEGDVHAKGDVHCEQIGGTIYNE